MKTSLMLFTILAVLVLTSAPAAANPTMLPKHPGYPMDKAHRSGEGSVACE